MNNPNQPEAAVAAVEDAVRTHSRPADLRITDMRIAVVTGICYYPLIRIDTNQGIYGLGEVRDGGHPESALRLKHFLLGQNPCNIDMVFNALRQYGGPGREGGFGQGRFDECVSHVAFCAWFRCGLLGRKRKNLCPGRGPELRRKLRLSDATTRTAARARACPSSCLWQHRRVYLFVRR